MNTSYINQIIDIVTNDITDIENIDAAILKAHSIIEADLGIFMNISLQDVAAIKELICN